MRGAPQALLELDFISHHVFFKSFRKSQFPHKSVNVFDSNVHLRHPWDESAPAPPAQWRWRLPCWRQSEYEEVT